MIVDGIPKLKDLEINGKVVFLRLDLNVPMKDAGDGKREITDLTRINAAIPTIRYCLENKAHLVIGSHLGRPKTEEDRTKFSLEPVAEKLGELMNVEVILVEDPLSDAPRSLAPALKENQVLLLENLRFFSGETKNDIEFANCIAKYSDIYVNDAFGACHRAHSSIVASAEAIEKKAMGLLIEKEIEMLNVITESPKHPYVAILGGAKVSDKIAVIDKLVDKADTFIIGGAMAYTFLKAAGHNVGSSLVEEDRLSFARDLIERLAGRDKSLLLPVDHVVSDKFDGGEVRTTTTPVIDEGWMGLDIGE